LTTIDVGKYFSIYGQTVILFLIQDGGLGYMSIIVFFLFDFTITARTYKRISKKTKEQNIIMVTLSIYDPPYTF
jgi:Trk-type K+ transport system membrane component